jgi:hypothetical protein
MHRHGVLKPNIVTVIYWIAVKTGIAENRSPLVIRLLVSNSSCAAGSIYIGASGEVVHVDSRYVVLSI